MEQSIITREEAKARGLKRYFTGKPCERGHVAERYVSARACLGCHDINGKSYREVHRDKIKERSRQWYLTHKEHSRKLGRAWRARLSADPHSSKNSILIAKHILRGAHDRARRLKVEFSLTPQDILPLPVYCPMLQHELLYITSRGSQNSIPEGAASIDRINNKRGYVSGNVHIISWRANHVKNNATVEELRAVLSYCEAISAFSS